MEQGPRFVHTYVAARKDLLDFIEERVVKNARMKIGKDPQKWIEELNIIHHMIEGEGIVAGVGLWQPPKDDPAFQKIGDTVYYSRVQDRRLRGLWIKNTINGNHEQWTHYQLGHTGSLMINPEFKDIPFEAFLPEHFEKQGRLIKSDKRPIRTFEVLWHGKPLTVYAKGCDISISVLYEPPWFRQTPVCSISKTTSEVEMQRTLELANEGISVPKVIGYYKTLAEEYAFFAGVEGTCVTRWLPHHRDAIITQDAQMLATLCRLGHQKLGFTSLDDKLYDGERLSLIDMDEFRDLYFPASPDFRKVLLDPTDADAVSGFRGMQRALFLRHAKDAIYEYRENLLPEKEHQERYLAAFCQSLGIEVSLEEKQKLLTFGKDYCTLDSSISMLTED